MLEVSKLGTVRTGTTNDRESPMKDSSGSILVECPSPFSYEMSWSSSSQRWWSFPSSAGCAPSAVLGYLVAGALIGPHSLGLVRDVGATAILGQFRRGIPAVLDWPGAID